MRIICEYCGREIRQVADGTDRVKKSVCQQCLKKGKDKKGKEYITSEYEKTNRWALDIIENTLFGKGRKK